MSETETEDSDSIKVYCLKLHAFIFWTDLKVNILKIITAVHSSYSTSHQLIIFPLPAQGEQFWDILSA